MGDQIISTSGRVDHVASIECLYVLSRYLTPVVEILIILSGMLYTWDKINEENKGASKYNNIEERKEDVRRTIGKGNWYSAEAML